MSAVIIIFFYSVLIVLKKEEVYIRIKNPKHTSSQSFFAVLLLER